MRIVPFINIIGLAACACLASCAQQPANGKLGEDQGARRAKVLEQVAPQLAAAELQSCVPADWDWEAQTWVRVRYRTKRVHHTMLAAAPPELAPRTGDEVMLWLEDCDARRPAYVQPLPPSTVADR